MPSRTIDTAFVRAYEPVLQRLTQQEGSLLLPTLRLTNMIGQSKDFDRLDVLGVSLKSGVLQATPTQEAPISRRRLTAQAFHGSVDLDWEDDLKILFDPRGDLAENLKNALGRQLDDIIIAAAEGSAVTVSTYAGSTSTASIGNTIDEDYGTTNSDITLAKIKEANRIFQTNNVFDMDKYLILDPIAHRSLMDETAVLSSDYNNTKPTVTGVVGQILGFKIIVHTGLSAITSGFTGVNCLAYVPSGLKAAIQKPITVDVAKLPDRSFGDRIYASGAFGAVRMDDNKVIAIQAWRGS
jgi:hypothetical protein